MWYGLVVWYIFFVPLPKADLIEELNASQAFHRLAAPQDVLNEVLRPLQSEHVESLSHLLELPDADLQDFVQHYNLSLGARAALRRALADLRVSRAGMEGKKRRLKVVEPEIDDDSGPVALISNSTVCCLPSASKGVVCSKMESSRDCQGIAELQKPFYSGCRTAFLDPFDLAEQEALPTWSNATIPFVYVPGCALCIIVILYFIFSKLYVVLVKGHVHKLITTHIGSLYSPEPRKPWFMIKLCWAQLYASLMTMSIFIFNTYHRSLLPVVQWMEVTLGIFFAFNMFVFALKYEFSLYYFFRVGQLVDLFTVPNMLFLSTASEHQASHRWLSLNFLRTIQAVVAYESLDALGALKTGFDEVSHAMFQTALRFCAFISTFASAVLLLEILGELPLPGQPVHTSMGDISFFIMIYWIVETISTVGYGDFTPQTCLSRLVTILCMISGVAFFTLELDKILNISSKVKQGSGSFQKTTRPHVVLIGGGVQNADETLLLAFLEEMYHPSLVSRFPDLVMLTTRVSAIDSLRDIIGRVGDQHIQQHVTYLVGSPLHLADLNRCRVDAADMVFILADTTDSKEPADEDTENIILALSLVSGFPHVRMRLMLLMPESKETAVSIGIRAQQCFSVNELKSYLFWQSCLCVGWNTMLCNMMVTTDDQVVSKEDLAITPWLGDYITGMGHEVYGFIVVEDFHHKPFRTLVSEAYRKNGICIFAAQIDGKILLSPFEQLESMQKTTVVFALAQDEESLKGIAIDEDVVDWKEIFNAQRQEMFRRQDKGRRGDDSKSEQSELSPQVRRGSTILEKLSEKKAAAAAPAFEDAQTPLLSGEDACEEGRDLENAAKSEQGFENLLEKDEEGGVKEKGEKEKRRGHHIDVLDERMSFSDVVELERQVRAIRNNSRHKPFVLLLDLSGSWKQVVPLVQQSRAPYLPFRMPIVVLCHRAPPKSLLDELGLVEDDAIAFLPGEARSVPDLVLSGAKECSVIVCFGQNAHNAGVEKSVSDVAMLDAEVVMVHRVLDRLGASRKSMILEFKRVDNMRMLPKVGVDHSKNQSPRRSNTQKAKAKDKKQEKHKHAPPPPPQAEEVGSMSDARFASGQIFTPQVLGALMARVFRTPGIVEVMQALIMPDTNDEKGIFPWQIHPKPEYVGISYGDLFCSLVQDAVNPVLPLGLFRCEGQGKQRLERGEVQKYVLTNPSRDVEIRANDLIYVLGDREFGKTAMDECILALSGKARSPSEENWSLTRSRLREEGIYPRGPPLTPGTSPLTLDLDPDASLTNACKQIVGSSKVQPTVRGSEQKPSPRERRPPPPLSESPVPNFVSVADAGRKSESPFSGGWGKGLDDQARSSSSGIRKELDDQARSSSSGTRKEPDDQARSSSSGSASTMSMRQPWRNDGQGLNGNVSEDLEAPWGVRAPRTAASNAPRSPRVERAHARTHGKANDQWEGAFALLQDMLDKWLEPEAGSASGSSGFRESDPMARRIQGRGL